MHLLLPEFHRRRAHLLSLSRNAPVRFLTLVSCFFLSYIICFSFCNAILHSCIELHVFLVAAVASPALAPAVASSKQPSLPESDSPVGELPSKAFFGSIGAGAGSGAGLVAGPGREHLPGDRDLSWVGPLGVGMGSMGAASGAGIPRRRQASEQWDVRALRRQTTTPGDSPVLVDHTATIELQATMERLLLEQRKHLQQLEDTRKVSP